MNPDQVLTFGVREQSFCPPFPGQFGRNIPHACFWVLGLCGIEAIPGVHLGCKRCSTRLCASLLHLFRGRPDQYCFGFVFIRKFWS